jgi:hypothetical protein
MCWHIFLESATILFYVNDTAVPVHSNNLRAHNGNIETQCIVDIQDDSLSSSSASDSVNNGSRGSGVSMEESVNEKLFPLSKRCCREGKAIIAPFVLNHTSYLKLILLH